MKVILDDANWKVFLMKKYVDDINVMFEAVRMGYRWIRGKLEWSITDEIKDRRSKLSKTRINMNLFINIANSIYPSLKFTMKTTVCQCWISVFGPRLLETALIPEVSSRWLATSSMRSLASTPWA